MSLDDQPNPLAESGVTMRSDSEQYSPGDELSTSPASTSSSPVILYKPPTIWSLLRGTAINILLPFINGMMLGFGELFAHEAAFRLGWGGTKTAAAVEVKLLAVAPENYPAQLSLQEKLPAPVHTPTGPVRNLASQPHRTGTMIPSRGIVRSFPAGFIRGQPTTRLIGRTFATRSIPSSRNAAIISGQGMRARISPSGAGITPLALGSVAASRNLSLWGWGGGSKTSEQALEEARRAEAAAQEQQHAASSAADAATDSISAVPPLTEPTATAPLANSDLSDFGGGGGNSGLSATDLLDLSSTEPGYLAALGLDNGWGPTSVMQWLLEYIHTSTGFGWGMSIVASAFALRAAMLIPHIMQMRNGGRVAHMQADPRAVEMNRLTKESLAAGVDGMEKRQQAKVIADLLKKEYGVNNANLLWLVVQFPFTIGLFKLVRQMGNLPVPGMEDAGFLWFTDLTARDPYFVLPALATGLMILSLQIGQKYMASAQRKMMKPMSLVLGGVGFVFTSFLAAGINVMGIAFAGATLATSLILEIPSLRRRLGLLMGPPPEPASSVNARTSSTVAGGGSSLSELIPKGIRYEAPRGAAAPPPKPTTAQEVVKPLSFAERVNSSFNDAKQGMSQQLGSFGGRMAATDAEKAERNRKELMQKLEDKRRQQEREEFSRKYKGKK